MKRYVGDDYYFVINRAKLQDRGEYIIRAENHYGSREEVVFLNVQRNNIDLIIKRHSIKISFYSITNRCS